MPFSKYCINYPSPEDPDSRILFLTKNSAKALVPSSLLSAIENQSVSEAARKALLRPGFIVDDLPFEQEEMLDYPNRLNRLSKVVYAKVVMNLDCNLACTYCFEGSRKGKLYMSLETANLFVEFIMGRLTPHKNEISLTFYGGEPLLSSDLICHISERLKTIAEAKGIIFGFSLITNGTLLTPEIVSRLKPLGLRKASVTLDGPRETHNQYRPFVSGGGSFDAIVRNIRAMCDIIQLQIGGNYTRDNYNTFPQLLDYLLENGLPPDCFGGCRYMKYIREGNMNGIDCKKPYLDATLEAMVKQDIQYTAPSMLRT